MVIKVARRLRSADVIDVLADLFIMRGIPGHIRSDNGPEFVVSAGKDWITGLGTQTAYIEPGSPWENGYVESFKGKLRDELLACEVFNSLAEAKVLIEQWHKHYNTVRPHSALGYRPSRAGGDADGVTHAAKLSRAHRISNTEARYALTFRLDHLVGAGQPASTPSSRPPR